MVKNQGGEIKINLINLFIGLNKAAFKFKKISNGWRRVGQQ